MMQIRLRDFRASKPLIIKAYLEKGIGGVREVCVLSSIAFIAAYSYILEDYDDPETRQNMERLVEFYKVDEIVKDI